MKKVFRILKLLECDLRAESEKSLRDNIRNTMAYLRHGWPCECEGKTVEECRKLGYSIDNLWLVEEGKIK